MFFKFFSICFFLIFNVHSYEWTQVLSDGFYNRTIESKISNPRKIEDVSLVEKKLSKEDLKKFPNIEGLKKIVIIGDTGCRLKEKGNIGEYQNCNDINEWPFERIIENSAKENPDLVIHLGDYHYREQCSKGRECEKINSPVGYDWLPWELDFFKPSEKLFKVAPFIIVRGNHEDCGRAYLIYKKFLRNENWNEECKQVENYQILKFGELVIINIDTSIVDDRPEISKESESFWVDTFNKIDKDLEDKKISKAWIVTHKPFYGVAPFLKTFVPTNINLRNYLEKSKLLKKIDLIFAGHVHTSAIIKTQRAPTQIILGNSGTKLENLPDNLNSSILKLFGYNSVDFANTGFGYAVAIKESKSWQIDFKDSFGKIIKTFKVETK